MKPVEAKSAGIDAMLERVRAELTRRRVSPEIINRVARLNRTVVEGERLRGIHYTTQRDMEPVWLNGMWRKGWFLREHGREAWARLPRWSITKRGRREYVAREAVEDNLWLAA